MPLLSLKNQKAFDLVNKHGRKRSGSCMILVLASNFTKIESDNDDTTFFGMKVSRKFSKKAVIRNKAKRRIRSIARNITKNPDIKTKNTAFIVIPKKGFDQMDFERIKSDFYYNFKQLLAPK